MLPAPLHIVHDYYDATGISRDTLGATPAEVAEINGKSNYMCEENMGEGAVLNDERLGDCVFDVGYINTSRNYLQFVHDENDMVTLSWKQI